jgi:hypothetical protein
MMAYRESMKQFTAAAAAALVALCLTVMLPGGSATAQPKLTTAAVSWTPGAHLRVYISDGKTVYERGFDGSGWYTGGFKANGSDVSATSWVDGGTLHIRVYVTDGSKVVEHCWDGQGPWYIGGFTQ